MSYASKMSTITASPAAVLEPLTAVLAPPPPPSAVSPPLCSSHSPLCLSKRDTNYRLPISSCPLPVSPGLRPYSRTSRLAHLEDQLVRTHPYIHQP